MKSMATQITASVIQRAPVKRRLGVGGWLKINLFSTWYNTLLTFLSLWLIYHTVSSLLRWGIWNAAFGTTPESCKQVDGACWSFIADMWPLFMVGTYPFAERWRPLVAFLGIALLLVLSFFPVVRRWRGFYLLWAFASLGVFLLIRGYETVGLQPVETSLWGGLMLTIILTVGGIVVAFPLGILLALGRRSKKMPIIRAFSTAYIELIRGVPLITILFMASVMLPLFFPAGTNIDKLLRAQVGIILFQAAYLAEIIRGGLQGLSKGQEEAAMALGLNYWQMMMLIILPQALRIVIPPLVNQFISLLKDTSLVTIIGLFDLLGVATMATANPAWVGKIIEAYVFIGAIYWLLCFAMSRYSRRLEIRFHVDR
jgi:general L-amino acid transport system permease protein